VKIEFYGIYEIFAKRFETLLNSNKIQISFFRILQSKIWRAFGVGPKRKVVPLEIIYQHAKFGEF
jgi:hypothetical protein